MSKNEEPNPFLFLPGTSVMHDLIRAKDWSKTPVGAPETWPTGLCTTVSILLNSHFPMFVWWGEALTTIYNDAYMLIAGDKHPELLGKSGRAVWSEIWDDLSHLVGDVFNGNATWSEDQLLYLNRRGYKEEAYFTFSYSPVFDERGTVQGLFCAVIETTEKVLATKRIEESERNMRSIILQSPVAMCILRGAAFTVEIANERMYELWGKRSDQVLQRPLFEGLPEARNQGFEQLLEQVYATGVPFTASERPVQLPRKNGIETVYVNFVYEPFRDGNGGISGIIAVANDVSEQVQARKRIEESEQELQLRVRARTAELESQRNLLNSILTNSSNGISVTEIIRDAKGNVIDATTILANDAAVRFTGLPKDVYLSKKATDLDPDIFSKPYGKTCVQTLATGAPAFIQYFLEVTGRWLELTISKMDDDHLIHIFTDVTPIKESQLQLEKTVEELRRSNRNLEEFAHAASHDLKEPVRKVHLFSNMLKQSFSSLDTEQQRLFERVEDATQRMGLLIDDLLEYSHVSMGVDGMEEIDLNEKLQVVLSDLEIAIQEKGAHIITGRLPTIKGHRRQLQQLFHNLIQNALKYSKKEVAPQIHITAKTVTGGDAPFNLTEEEKGRTFQLITIKDNGIGFEQQHAEQIFQMFKRLHGKGTYTGSGVGLAIVKKVVENHNGYISADGKPGEGATFNVLLPAE
jgi:PAS domain S-box-containing protein